MEKASLSVCFCVCFFSVCLVWGWFGFVCMLISAFECLFVCKPSTKTTRGRMWNKYRSIIESVVLYLTHYPTLSLSTSPSLTISALLYLCMFFIFCFVLLHVCMCRFKHCFRFLVFFLFIELSFCFPLVFFFKESQVSSTLRTQHVILLFVSL